MEIPDLGAANEELNVEYDDDPLEIGFNAQYLLELLRYMSTDVVRMTFKARSAPPPCSSPSATRTRPTTRA